MNTFSIKKPLPNSDDLEFLTGSKFFGISNKLGMQKYGVYQYPDGAKYTGNFLNGRFHGNGTIELSEPYCMSFSVEHQHGKLTHIISINFSDNLPVDFSLNKDKINFDNWKYCTAEDRWFHTERSAALDGMGPSKCQTKDATIPTQLPCNVFDLGFGMLDEFGFISNMPKHIGQESDFYLGCRNERRRIREHCRHGPLEGKHLKKEWLARYARQIIANNLKNAEEEPNQIAKSLKTAQSPRHKYKTCPCSNSEKSSEKELCLHIASTSETCSSSLERSLNREQDTISIEDSIDQIY